MTKKDKGIVSFRVHRITKINEPGILAYWLDLDRTPATDHLQVRIRGQIYEDNQIRVVVVDKINKRIRVSIVQNNDPVKNCAPGDIIVVSDLRFLVKRVEYWYKQFGNKMRLPNSNSKIHYPGFSELEENLSEDQMRAIEGVLNNPFTYIWGAPGTGKTKIVLARAILSYIKAGKKVLVAGPTNNAIEQSLRGILPIMEKCGYDYNKLVLRLGTASEEFASQYPGVCEEAGFGKRLGELNDRISAIKSEINELSKQKDALAEYLYKKEQYEYLTDKKNEIDKLIHGMELLRADYKELNTLLFLNRKKVKEYKDDIEIIQQDIGFLQNNLEQLIREQKSFRGKWKSLFKKDYYKDLFEEENKKIEEKRNEENEINEEIDKLNKSIKSDSAKEKRRKDSFAKKKDEIRNILIKNEFLYRFSDTIEINSPLDIFRDRINQRRVYYAESIQGSDVLNGKGIEELDTEIKELEVQKDVIELEIKQLKENHTGKRVEDCQVIAATVDGCISRLQPVPENAFDHVFLDEAGYCPLIKGVTLTGFQTKLTFLGDHMQLPPVCEMDDEEMIKYESRLVSIWSMSSLYTAYAFTKDPEDLYTFYIENAPLPREHMKRYDLLRSYRFGNKLASVLADDVYERGFHGRGDNDTFIYYIDVPRVKNPGEEKRSNVGESEAIIKALKQYPELQSDFGVLTPYRNQVKLLQKRISASGHPRDYAMTVHRSQGREWSTVFFSVTDTTDKFFTNSLNTKSAGKKVVNTAVSRAKNKLIIVCDYHYWVKQRSQLIGKLLLAAKEIKLSSVDYTVGKQRIDSTVGNDERKDVEIKNKTESNDKNLNRHRPNNWGAKEQQNYKSKNISSGRKADLHSGRDDRMRQVLNRRGIEYLVHFTRTENLDSVLRQGIIPRNRLNQYASSSIINDDSRFEGRIDCNCLTITRANNRLRYQYYYNDKRSVWAILYIDTEVLFQNRCYFVETNAANSKKKSKDWSFYQSPEALESMFAAVVEGKEKHIRSQEGSLAPNETTDEQAEVLVEGRIPPECIRAVIFENRRYMDDFLSKNPQYRYDRRFRVDKDSFSTRGFLNNSGGNSWQ